jgi:hypothetical protein
MWRRLCAQAPSTWTRLRSTPRDSPRRQGQPPGETLRRSSRPASRQRCSLLLSEYPQSLRPDCLRAAGFPHPAQPSFRRSAGLIRLHDRGIARSEVAAERRWRAFAFVQRHQRRPWNQNVSDYAVILLIESNAARHPCSSLLKSACAQLPWLSPTPGLSIRTVA